MKNSLTKIPIINYVKNYVKENFKIFFISFMLYIVNRPLDLLELAVIISYPLIILGPELIEKTHFVKNFLKKMPILKYIIIFGIFALWVMLYVKATSLVLTPLGLVLILFPILTMLGISKVKGNFILGLVILLLSSVILLIIVNYMINI